ncbi:hypothetical protein AB0K21_21705 [Streptosporangium sp. NPDC049248]|uniref:hypothetical protein n=1 Tax=Streptosporangium sp. NPDC049248 TaxID=3155651 RepID=UPI00341D355B
MSFGTPFVETEIMIAISAEDTDYGYNYARALLSGMTPSERRSLEHHCEEIMNLIGVMREDEE